VSRDGRRRRRLTVGLLVLAGAGLLGTAAGLVLAHARAPAERGQYAVRRVEGSERLELLAGRIDLPGLAEALARDGRADILARRWARRPCACSPSRAGSPAWRPAAAGSRSWTAR
jgi:hypothetical protein